MSSVRAKVAVVTGAGSDIGRELAFELVRQRADRRVRYGHNKVSTGPQGPRPPGRVLIGWQPCGCPGGSNGGPRTYTCITFVDDGLGAGAVLYAGRHDTPRDTHQPVRAEAVNARFLHLRRHTIGPLPRLMACGQTGR